MEDKCLKIGTVVRSPKRNYTIIKVLGYGGFGITYLAEGEITDDNITFTNRFAIKEHFINSFCTRDPNTQNVMPLQPLADEVDKSLKAFLSEAKRLKDLGISHRSIVKVNEVFEANSTAYFVMEYLDGGSLAEYIKDKGRLSFEEMASLMKPICDCVSLLHNNHVAHYDIKPQNIMLVNDHGSLRPVLIDFGLAKHYDGQGNATSTLVAAGYTPGYAPVEQYGGFTTFQPTADVYALGATMLFCLTGHTPARAQDIQKADIRNELLGLNLKVETIDSLLSALEYRPDDRPADAILLASAIFGSIAVPMLMSNLPSTKTVSGNNSSPKTLPEKQRTKNYRSLVVVTIIAVVAISFSLFNVVVNVAQRSEPADSVVVSQELVQEESIQAVDTVPSDVAKTEDKQQDQVEQPIQEKRNQVQPSEQQTQKTPQRQSQELTAEDLFQKAMEFHNKKDYYNAAIWYRKAADQGHVEAQYIMGLLNTLGEGVPQSDYNAFYWYKKAAENGHVEAQMTVGDCYSDGRGVTQSDYHAFYWYKKAAEQGDPFAQTAVGICYEYGSGVSKNKTIALRWYRKAAAQGIEVAWAAVRRLEGEGFH